MTLEAEAFVNQVINDPEFPVVMFAFEWCEFCWSVRKLFGECGIPFRSVDLDSAEYQKNDWGGQVRAALRKATIANEITPVLCGSAFKNKGVRRLLDAVVDYLPAPFDVPPVTGHDPKTDKVMIRKPSDVEPFSALAFKIATDPHVGKLVFFRVYSGSAQKGSAVLNTTSGKKERMSRILRMHANKREEMNAATTGNNWARVRSKSYLLRTPTAT